MELVVVDSVEVISAEEVPSALIELELNPKTVLEGISETKVVASPSVLVANVEYPASGDLALETELISGSTKGFAEFAVVISASLEGLSLQMFARLKETQIRV